MERRSQPGCTRSRAGGGAHGETDCSLSFRAPLPARLSAYTSLRRRNAATARMAVCGWGPGPIGNSPRRRSGESIGFLLFDHWCLERTVESLPT